MTKVAVKKTKLKKSVQRISKHDNVKTLDVKLQEQESVPDLQNDTQNDEKTEAATSCKIEYETDDEQTQNKPTKRRQKLIAFIGNLPYGITEERLREFLNMNEHIIEIRLPRNAKNKSRTQGYAFCEFNDKLAFRKCLLLHHSKFEGRRINVELTAGGGGNTQNRKKKIAIKNREADKWRAKRMQKQQQELNQSDKKDVEKQSKYKASSK